MKLEFTSETEAVNWAIDFLRTRDFIVESTQFGPWESPYGLWKRLFPTMAYQTFSDRLRKATVPFPARRGQSGRLIALRITDDLLTVLMRPLAPGRPSL